jgi:PPK2 family polyphosphate:nucleotide phosphotransferase
MPKARKAPRRASFAHTVDGRQKVRLDDFDPADTAGVEKAEALDRIQKLGTELSELENLLTYAGTHALLVVLQGRDASGKDGAIRKILEFSNIQQSYVQPFKVPTEEERAHDFLWRVHKAVPRRGHVTLFNRSHYEDVLAARVHKIVPESVWKARYDHINAFERLVTDAGVIVLKFYLHISAEEQYERLRAREKDPRTAWKLNPEDWREVPLWDEFTEAYEDALTRCATRNAPWYLVPADKKWFRNLAVVERIVLALRPYKERWLDTLRELGKDRLQEIKTLRSQIKRPRGR